MYICQDCGKLTDYLVSWVEDYGQKFKGCPACYGYCEEAFVCSMCDEYSDTEYWLEDGQKVCVDCYYDEESDDI